MTNTLTAEQIAQGKEAFEHITNNMTQLDQDGIMVSVSREALEAVLWAVTPTLYPPSLPSSPVLGEVWPEKRLPEGWRVHELKTWPDAFDAMRDGRKLFEFRKHDRDYRVGDQILSRRFDPDAKDYTGECDRFEVTFMLVAGQYGVPAGYAVLGVKPYSSVDQSSLIKALTEALEDVVTHADNWLHAMNIAQAHGAEDDRSYWEHQKRALRDILAVAKEAN